MVAVEVFALGCDVFAICQALGHTFHTAIVFAPANTGFIWNTRLFNTAVSRAAQLTIFIGDVGVARNSAVPVADFVAA
eukprot:11204812-Lingulodinium_polyedra.AAC.1